MKMDLLKVKNRALSFMKPARSEFLKWFRGQYKIDEKRFKFLKPGESLLIK